MQSDAQLRVHLLVTFKNELDEYLTLLNKKLIELEQDGESTEILKEIFRIVHNLKGAAGAIGLAMIQKIAHNLETIFGAVRSQQIAFSTPLFDLCYEGLDTINKLIEAEIAGEELPTLVDNEFEQKVTYLLKTTGSKKTNIQYSLARDPDQTESSIMRQSSDINAPNNTNKKADLSAYAHNPSIRVPLNKIDRLMSNMGEILMAKSRNAERLNVIKQLDNEIKQTLKNWGQMRSLRRKLAIVSTDQDLEKLLLDLEMHQNYLNNISNIVKNLTKAASNDDLYFGIAASDIQQETQVLRMMPISTLFEPLRRQARDLARKHEKSVAIEFAGGNAELDRQLIEAIREPITHIIRNCIDHGIEPPEYRKQIGKNPDGIIKLVAEQRGNRICIEISDDGAGINLEKVKQQALILNLYSEADLETITKPQLLELIFNPGFSTSTTITETSGRGVGLDIVKVNVEGVQGQIEITTQKAIGTIFHISLPLTLSTLHMVLVKVAEQIFAFPVNSIECTLKINLKDCYTIESCMAISLDSKSIFLIDLGQHLGMATDNIYQKENFFVLVVAISGERVAFIVDEILGEQELVIKSLGKLLKKVRNISGASVLGDGRVVLLLNPAELLTSVRGYDAKKATPINREVAVSTRRKILIVDDSITTRTLEKNILELAGYEVFLAKDGGEGLSMVRTSGCELVITDIEMPVLNGFELTKQIKMDPQLKHIPIILVSSLGSQEDKVRGMEAGATAYIVKSNFEQANFLDIVDSMLS